MFERFTVPAREAVVRARDEARAAHAPQIGTEHLLLALLDDRASVAYPALTAAGVSADAVRAELTRLVSPAPGLLTDADAEALRSVGIDLDAVLARITDTFGPDALTPSPTARGRWRRRTGGSTSRFSPGGRKVMGIALREAIRLGDRHIDDGHLLLGLVRGDELTNKIMTTLGVPVEQLRAAVESRRSTA
jgi:ATP-dependent Clp protease ATP-binding subunit ClpA